MSPLGYCTVRIYVLNGRSEQPDPSNMQGVCTGSNATAVVDYICEKCDDKKATLSDFEGACLAAGMDICTLPVRPPLLRKESVTDEVYSATEGACSPKPHTSSSGSHTAAHTGHHSGTATGTMTGGSDATASASQSAGSAEGSNAARENAVGAGGIGAALLFAALVAA